MKNKAAIAEVDFAPARVEKEDLGGGAFVLRSLIPLGDYARSLGEYLRRWARETPDRPFLVERHTVGGWREVTYAQAWRSVEAIGHALLDRGISSERPVMILSDNSIDNALLQQGCMYVGVPVVPVSPAYSLMSKDHGKLRRIFDLIKPRMVYADNGRAFAKALASLDLEGVELVVSSEADERFPTTSFDSLTTTRVTEEVGEAFAQVGPDTVAKILFTSGSTGLPKGVINTQRMMCSNQQAIAQAWPFIEKKPPTTVDWLPWHHTFGGNHNFNMILRNGGTMYVDTGKPVPGWIERTVANLREISPTIYFNVPRGFGELLSFMEKDQRLRDTFFAELDLVFYAAASLPQPLWERLEELATTSRGLRVQMASAWGATETAPMAALVHFTIEQAGVIGLPAPGTELKFVPSGSKLEMLVRGPNVTPGYYQRDDLTEAAFDEDGFYRIGDAGKLVDPAEPVRGVVFDGRTAEDFKMASGSWVHVGWLRVAAIAAVPEVIQDAVVTGHDRDEVGLLIFPNLSGIKNLAGDAPKNATLSDLIAREAVREAVRCGLSTHNRDHTRTSTRIRRALLMDRPPAIDADEVTDKGYINQLAVLDCRADLVERLYAGGSEVIVVD